jgi:antitoxin CcdA
MKKIVRSKRKSGREPGARGFSESAKPFRASHKRATNVSIDAELLQIAKELGINLSETLEERLRQITKAERERRWKIENRAYIESFNRYIDENGIFGEDLQTW